MKIPKRSFIRSTVDEKKNDWFSKSTGFVNEIILGNLTAKRLLTLMGLIIKSDIQKKIKSGIKPRLKRRTGTPLWDTGQLINSIRYVTSLGDDEPK